MNIILLLILPLSSTYSYRDLRTEYLVRLIQAETERAETYTLPVDSDAYRPWSKTQYELGTFTHIVIGAGSAGAIVAARLSEDCEKHVLLLDAGGYESDFTDIPAMSAITEDLQYNWNYKSVVQNKSCLSLNGLCSYRAGRGLGGSTIINGLFYARGCKADYDRWDPSGESDWNYENILAAFKKLENYQIDGDRDLHGYSGPVSVDFSEPINPKTPTFLDANRELGQEIGDYNGDNPLRAGRVQVNNILGQRCSTGRAYLRRAWRHRRNLHILPHSYVTKILINATTKEAYGVIFARFKRYFVAKSRSEIVLSAGTYRSPQLLMLSGIGPASHLANLNIPVVQDLPVGNFFKDHLSYVGLTVHTNHSNVERQLRDKVRDYLNGRGELTEGGALGVVFLKSSLSTEVQRPDIEIVMYRGNNNQTVIIVPVLLHPKSHGSVTLQSTDPFDYPLVDPNFWSDPNDEDVKVMLEGIRYVQSLIETKAFKEVNAELIEIRRPECRNHSELSDEYFKCQIKYLSNTFTHTIGTCKMGASPSAGAVVDYNLKVYGIGNLMVADASVMPDTISGHTSAPSMMIGERAAAIITRNN